MTDSATHSPPASLATQALRGRTSPTPPRHPNARIPIQHPSPAAPEPPPSRGRAVTRRSDDPIRVPPGVDPDQLAFPFDASPIDTSRRTSPFRSYDDAVLAFVAQQRIATAHQVVYRFATYDGKARGHIVRVIRSLVDRGWLRSAKLDPALGRASRQVLTLSDMAWRDLGEVPPRDPMTLPRHARDGLLQDTEFRLEHECRGWLRAGESAAAWRALHAAAAQHFKTVDRSESGHADWAVIDRLKPDKQAPLPVEVWVQPATKSAMLVMPSRRGFNIRATLAAMPDLALWPVLRIHLVGADPRRLQSDAYLVREWARRTNHRVALEALAPFRTRAHPSDVGRLPVSLYALHGVPSPRASLALKHRRSHAPGATCDHNSRVANHPAPGTIPPRPLVEGLNPPPAPRRRPYRPSRLLPMIGGVQAVPSHWTPRRSRRAGPGDSGSHASRR